jgi:hypothetical protein
VILPDTQATAGAVLSTAVDTTRAFLVFGVSEDSFDPRDGHVSGQLVGPTTLSFDRIGTTGALTIKWYVIEFASGVSVLRGTADLSVPPAGDVTDVSLPAPGVDMARSFPLISYRTEGVNFNCNDFVRAKITSPTNLQLSTDNTNCGIGPSLVEWQVVEYADADVRTGDVVFAPTDFLQTAPLAPVVDAAKSWLIYSHEGTPVGTDVGQFLVRGEVARDLRSAQHQRRPWSLTVPDRPTMPRSCRADRALTIPDSAASPGAGRPPTFHAVGASAGGLSRLFTTWWGWLVHSTSRPRRNRGDAGAGLASADAQPGDVPRSRRRCGCSPSTPWPSTARWT